MKSWFNRFNIYLIIVLISLGTGCQTGKDKKDKEASTLRFHLEVNRDGTSRNMPVAVYRAEPILVNIDNMPFLSEADIDRAAVVESPGGFSIMIQFNQHGIRVLELTTTSYKGRKIAIFSQFGDARWIAAPMITRRITDGLFVFTPDTSRQEAERIVRGLNNVAKEVKKDFKY